ncbi:MAG: hypothetical protein JNJ57_00865, partial [Saprospiraceae bacterium]|nr:hypothetical protein [Saprospiraceae bacterium]
MSKIYTSILILLALAVFGLKPMEGFSQNNPILPGYEAELYNAKNGLPASYIKRLFCDSRNRLWLATDLGVFRFDGYQFDNLKEKMNLAVDDLVCFTENPADGSVWIIGWTDRTCIWRISRADRIQIFTLPEGVFGKNGHWLTFDSNGRLWIATQNGIWSFSSQEVEQFVRAGHLPGNLPNSFSGPLNTYQALPMVPDGTGDGVYYAAKHRVFHANWRSKKVIEIGAMPEGTIITTILVHPSQQGALFLGVHWADQGYGIFKMEQTGTCKPFGKSDDGICLLKISADGKHLEYADTNGYGILELSTGKTVSIQGIWDNLPIGFIITSVTDLTGNSWFGTNAGLAVLRKHPIQSGTFPHMAQEWQNGIFGLLPDHSGDMMIGANGGTVYTHHGKGNFKPLNLKAIGIITHEIHEMAYDRSGRLWMFNNWLGIQCLHQGKLLNFGEAEGLPIVHSLSSMYIDSNDRLWVGSGVSGVYLDNASKATLNSKFQTFSTGQEDASVACFAEYPKGRIWAGSNKGLLRYDTELGKFVRAHRDTVMINDLIFTPQG